MSTNFPTTIDSYTTKATGQTIQAADVNDPQSAIVALETKVGVDSSAVATSLDYKVTNAASINPGHLHGPAGLNATGSASSSTFYRGDGAWARPPTSITYFNYLAVSATSQGLAILNQYSDSTNGLAYALSGGTQTIRYINPTVAGGYQLRTYTADWASATAINSTVTLGAYLYVLFRNGTTSYQLWRYDKTNLAAGGTICTFAGQAYAYNNASQVMTTDGTFLYFNCKAGNSANDYVVSKYSFSGVALTYLLDVTCGASANTVNRILYIDSSVNIYGYGTSSTLIKKYNSAGVLQSTSNVVAPHYATNNVYTLDTQPYMEDSFVNSDTSSTFFMSYIQI